MAKEKEKLLNKYERLGNRQRKFWFIWNLIEAFILIAAGALAITIGVMSDQLDSSVQETFALVFACVVGAYIILDGILRYIVSLFNFVSDGGESSLLVSAFEITLGTVIVIWYETFLNIAITFIAVILMVVGALIIASSIFQIVRKLKALYVPILTIAFSALLIGLGIAMLILYYGKNDSFYAAVNIGLGVVLAGVGITQFIVVLIMNHKAKKNLFAKKSEEAPVEQIVDNPDEAEVETVHAEKVEPEEVKEETETPEEEEERKPVGAIEGGPSHHLEHKEEEEEEPLQIDVVDPEK